MNGNSLLTKAVEELLDGRYFVIPSYQRGYRWKGKQVEDLLNDLYSFATKPDRKDNEFYCLQPIIVQKIAENPEYPAPKFWLNPEKTDFYSFTVDDFRLDNYQNTKLEEKIEVAE